MQNEVTALELVKNFFFFHGLELEYQLCRAAAERKGTCSLVHGSASRFGAGALQSQGQSWHGCSDLERADLLRFSSVSSTRGNYS